MHFKLIKLIFWYLKYYFLSLTKQYHVQRKYIDQYKIFNAVVVEFLTNKNQVIQVLSNYFYLDKLALFISLV